MTADNKELELSKESKIFLKEASSWAKFLSILGFIGIGFMILAGLAFGSIMSSINPDLQDLPLPSFAFGLIYLIIAGIYFFPVLFLYRFVAHSQKALTNTDPFQLTVALKNLKYHYQLFGILAIIFIRIYLIAGLVLLVTLMVFK